jgi:hypothetical protein
MMAAIPDVRAFFCLFLHQHLMVLRTSDGSRGGNKSGYASGGNTQSGNYGDGGDGAVVLSLPTSRINIIDYSMSNTWFPGHVGGVSFAEIPSTTGNTLKPKRNRVICAVDFQVPNVRSVLN